MDLSRLNLSTDALDAIYTLMLKVESLDKKRIRAAKSLESLIELLNHASASADGQITEALQNLLALFSQEQLVMFKTLGAEVNVTTSSASSKEGANSTRVYRGQPVSAEATTESEQKKKGKKRVMYRGRETWI